MQTGRELGKSYVNNIDKNHIEMILKNKILALVSDWVGKTYTYLWSWSSKWLLFP